MITNEQGIIDPNAGDAPPKTRIADAGSARALLDRQIDDDQLASYRRSQIQGMIDGNPPYPEIKLKEMGMGDVANVNWGHAGAKIEAYVIPYFDMMTSVATYATVRTNYGKDAGKQLKWSSVITDKFQRLLARSNPSFLQNHQVAHKQLAIHGAGILFFPDNKDWQAKKLDTWNLVVPRGASVDWDNWEYCFILDDVYCEELYRYIEDPEVASRNGWDADQVRKAIMDAHEDDQEQRRPWEWYQKELRNNGVYYSYAKSKVIKLAHFYLKEYDGKISHYIFDRLNPTQWLYVKMSCYDRFSNAFTVFLNGVGNGYYHGVRGLGQMLYKYGEAYNRMFNSLMEGVRVASCVMFRPKTQADAEKIKTVQIGPMRLLPPGIEDPINFSIGPNLQAAMQTATFFQGQEADQTGSFAPSVSGGAGRKKGNKEIEAELGEKGRLTNTRAEIYLHALDLHYQEIFRRASNPNILSEDPGGPEALLFQKECQDAGVPMAALLSIEYVRATRSIGQGSSAYRVEAMERIMEMLPQLPESSRKNAINATITAILGQNGSADFGIPDEEKMDGQQLSIASLENNAFMSGGQTLVDPDQNHAVHLSVHMQFLGGLVKQVQERQIDPREALKVFKGGLPHVGTHLQYLEEDPTREDQFNEMNGHMSELLKIADQISSLAKDAQEQEDQQREQQQPQQDPKMAIAQNRIMLDRATVQNKIQLSTIKTQHQLKMADEKTAQRLSIERIKAAQKYGSIQP